VIKLLALAILAAGSANAASHVLAVSIDGVVHPITVEKIGHALEQAGKEQAAAILIRLNTPGGLLQSTREINERIVASPIPVITYVTPSGGRAASAGFFILQAGDIAVMAPGTNTGAASPVLLGQQMDPVMRQKAESDAAASLRSLAGRRGRDSALAEKAVLEAKSFTDREALDNKLIDLIARDEEHLLEQLNGRAIERFNGSKTTLQLTGAVIRDYQPTIRERIISTISDPNIAFVILILGGLGVYLEFSAPGLILPGVAGGILILMGLSALAVLPINWAGIALLILAATFFVLEAKFTSHGILGFGGAVSMVLGALILVDGPPELRIRLSTAVGVSLPFAAITTFLMTLVLRSRAAKVITGDGAMLGSIGVAFTKLAPEGKVHIRGEYWDATANTIIEAGAPVRVVAVDGLRLMVEPSSA
jgi:membrane-bound serine protease (ClpP class)